MNQYFKKGLFGLIFILLFVPMLQDKLSLFRFKPLNGYVGEVAEPEFNIKDWMSVKYQVQMDKFLDQIKGLQPFLVRIYNQLNFTLFKSLNAQLVVLGKEDYLFESLYIENYLGRNFIGEDVANERIAKLKFLQDTFKAKNIDLVVVFNPGKASFYPQYIPERFHPEIKTLSNYEYYKRRLPEAGINFLDFNNYFLKIKDTVTHPIYPKCGIHWSVYGMGLCVDTLIHYLEHLRHIKMVDFGWTKLDISKELRGEDYDVGDAMNIICKIPTEAGAYPEWFFKDDSTKTRPSVLSISDSFYWTIYGNGISGRLFRDDSFWFYYEEVNDTKRKETKVRDLNLKAEFEKRDIILLMAAETNLVKFPYGFIEDAYKIYFPADRAGRLRHFEKMIQLDPGWLKDVKTRATEGKMDLKTAIRDEAATTLLYKDSLVIDEKTITQKAASMSANEDWMAQIRKKATDRNISAEQMLRIDARWVLEREMHTYRRKYWP